MTVSINLITMIIYSVIASSIEAKHTNKLLFELKRGKGSYFHWNANESNVKDWVAAFFYSEVREEQFTALSSAYLESCLCPEYHL